MDVDFKRKKKAITEEIEIAKDDDCKDYEEDAQTYYKSLRKRNEKEQALKIDERKKTSAEELKKKKERQAYYKEIREIYKKKNKGMKK